MGRTYRKGTRSRRRRKNFKTCKGNKHFKRKIGRSTRRAPFFPFAGGSRKRHSYRRRRPHFRSHRYKRRHSHRHRKHKRSKKQKKSNGLFGFLFS